MLLPVKEVYIGLCHAAPCGALLAALFPGSVLLRVAAALVLSVGSCTEFSVTHSHRDFANVYTAWALALLPTWLAQGLALGNPGWQEVADSLFCFAGR